MPQHSRIDGLFAVALTTDLRLGITKDETYPIFAIYNNIINSVGYMTGVVNGVGSIPESIEIICDRGTRIRLTVSLFDIMSI